MHARSFSCSLFTLALVCALSSSCSDEKDSERNDAAAELADASDAEDAAIMDAEPGEDSGTSHDAGADGSPDAAGELDASADAAMDTSSDASSMDAAADAGLDADADAGTGASVDASTDTGTDGASEGGDASADASHSDAAAGDSGVGITFCPGEAQGCSLASEVCCLGAGCVAKAVGCGDAGASIGCDGPEDCTGSTPLCCASTQGLTCAATCAGLPVCNGEDDCDEGDNCVRLGGSGVGFCVPTPTGGSCTPACPSGQRCLFGTCIPSFDGGFPFPFEAGVGN